MLKNTNMGSHKKLYYLERKLTCFLIRLPLIELHICDVPFPLIGAEPDPTADNLEATPLKKWKFSLYKNYKTIS